MAIDTATPAESDLSLDDVFIVDADVHAHEAPSEIAPFTEPRWRAAVENVARIPRRYLSVPCYTPGAQPPLPGAALPTGRASRDETVWT
ncbi:MAG TPA: hypothetical protein VKX96_07925, partial [Chloroflexota bacterium]|nr:hypothetical protein [Chloroflexota bacterium]